jgi:hypothetical protein
VLHAALVAPLGRIGRHLGAADRRRLVETGAWTMPQPPTSSSRSPSAGLLVPEGRTLVTPAGISGSAGAPPHAGPPSRRV